MKINASAVALCLATLASPLCHAAVEGAAPSPTATEPASAPAAEMNFSSSSLPDAPGLEGTVAGETLAKGSGAPAGTVMKTGMKPFSALGVAVKFGLGGVGFDLATPIANKFNLRAGGMFFGYSPNLTEDGININGTLTFKTIDAHIDWLPWAGSFHISPGLTLYNGNHLSATAAVPTSQTFTLNDVTYTSDPTGAHPVTGAFDLKLGNKVAPSLTVGWGNMIPRKASSHWSVPFEIGFEYISTPTIALSLSGTACSASQTPNCQSIAADPTAMANVAAEQQKLQSDLNALQVYPIISIGVGYKFGFGH